MKELKSEHYRQVSGAGFGDTCGNGGSSSNGGNGNCGGAASSASTGAGGSYQDKSYQTSNRGSGSQANHLGSGGGFSFGGGCTGGGSSSSGGSSNYHNR